MFVVMMNIKVTRDGMTGIFKVILCCLRFQYDRINISDRDFRGPHNTVADGM